jgi:spore coat polysaccharide biosynthesis predicted glycosyltransferase SpsG
LVGDTDIVVIDSYKIEGKTYESIANKVKLLVSIDDYNRMNYPKGLVVNGSIYAEETSYPQIEGVEYLLGTEYMPLRQEFVNVKDRSINDKIKDILIAFGGNDLKNMTPKIRDFILEILKDVNLHIIIGSGVKNIKEFKSSKADRARYYFNLNALEIRELMLAVDLAVTAGGQTTYELARTATPSIGVCVADNQKMNLKGWEKVGFLKNVGWYDSPDLFERITEALNFFSSHKERAKSSQIGKKYVDGKGSMRIVQYIASKIVGNN